ncbi:MAG: Ig-like domain-containing protein [Clostridia bacterium]|nr:Ig-like domain-containing protein [Clostridia bacterium]
MKKIISYLIIFIIMFNIICSLSVVEAHNVELDPRSYITMPESLYNGSGTIYVSSTVGTTYDLYYQYITLSDEVMNQIKVKDEEAKTFVNREKPKLQEEYANVQALYTEYVNKNNSSTATTDEKQAALSAYQSASNTYKSKEETYNNKIEEYRNAIYNLTPTYLDGADKWTKTTDGKLTIDTSNYTGNINLVLWAKLVVGNDTYYDEMVYTTTGTKVQTISLDRSAATIKVGETLKLNVTTSVQGTINWSSNNQNIAIVSSDGTVTAKAKGVATITASAGGKTASCVITVTEGGAPATNNLGDFSNAKFTTSSKRYNNLTVYVENAKMNSDNRYYMYISKNKNDMPNVNTTGVNEIYEYTNGKKGAVFTGNTAQNILELKGQNYIYIIEKAKDGNTNIILKGKEIANPPIPGLGQRLDMWLYDANSTGVSNSISITESRKITYKIGMINSNEILKSFKNDSSDKAFNNLLKYAKSSKYLKTGSITAKGLNYNITKGMNVKMDGYYFVYMIVDDENGKYNALEDVAIYKGGADGKTMYHFAFSSIKVDDKKEVKTNNKKDDTVTTSKTLPHTGISFAIIVSILTVMVTGYILHKKDKNLNIK